MQQSLNEDPTVSRNSEYNDFIDSELICNIYDNKMTALIIGAYVIGKKNCGVCKIPRGSRHFWFSIDLLL